MAEATSFLVINVARIGDTLYATPAIRAIAAAYPAIRITVLGHRKRIDAIRSLPPVTRVAAISKKTAPWRDWFKRDRYDYALVYGFDEPLVAYGLRVAERVVAFRQKNDALNRRLFRCVEPPPFQREHAVQRHHLLPAALGIAPAGARIMYHVTPAETAAARARLAAEVPPGASPLIGLQISTFPAKLFRRWPVEYFAQLAERIATQWPHTHFLIYGDATDRAVAGRLKQRLDHCATVYAGRLRLRETAAIMSLTDLYIGLDTGPTHIMSAFDIPLVAIYHCFSPSRVAGPLDHPCAYVVDHPRLGGNCTPESPMTEISVDSVYAQVARALAEHSPRLRRVQ